MLKLLLFIFLIQTSACPTEKQAIDCFYSKCDSNQNGKISRKELESAIDKYLPWYKRIPFNLFGGVDQIIQDCDANKDGVLTAKEAYKMKTCLNSCYKKKMTISTFNC
jgi:Ca2+-binding EF-hand superfamily protein